MAVEGARGCGYRKVGGLYLVGNRQWSTCDRLKLEIPVCDCCGETLRPNRGLQPINAFKLFHNHNTEIIGLWGSIMGPEDNPRLTPCEDQSHCKVCFPTNTSNRSHKDYIIWIGREYYTEESFNAEAEFMGVSRRIPHIPDKLAIGRSVIYLAMRNNINRRAATSPTGRMIKRNGIFSVFIPQSLELLVWESDATEEYIADLERRNITPVIIPDGDEDHKPSRRAQRAITIESASEKNIDLMDGL